MTAGTDSERVPSPAPGPLLVTTLAAVRVSEATYLVGGDHGRSSHADDMADHDSAHAGGLSGGRIALVWIGLALVTAQVWDLTHIRSPRLETMS